MNDSLGICGFDSCWLFWLFCKLVLFITSFGFWFLNSTWVKATPMIHRIRCQPQRSVCARFCFQKRFYFYTGKQVCSWHGGLPWQFRTRPEPPNLVLLSKGAKAQKYVSLLHPFQEWHSCDIAHGGTYFMNLNSSLSLQILRHQNVASRTNTTLFLSFILSPTSLPLHCKNQHAETFKYSTWN